jgi:tetratricopeptide (TPR) repeat protein
MNKKTFLLIAAFFSTQVMISAQEINWPSPDVALIYEQAKNNFNSGNYLQAITLFKQAQQQAPNVMEVYRDLGQAQVAGRKYADALVTIEPIIKQDVADEVTYDVAFNANMGIKEDKKAKTILMKGLSKFPNSGILFYDKGKMEEADKDFEKALPCYVDGMKNDPSYHLNFLVAAKAALRSSQAVAAIIYAETYLNLERNSPKADEAKDVLMNGYRRIFIGVNKVAPTFGKPATALPPDLNFFETIQQTCARFASVTSDGYNTENLTMLRARFIMEWSRSLKEKYPFLLFSYQEKMMKEGKFDTYNQWLFGKIDNQKTYETWLSTHNTAMPELEQWISENKFELTSTEFYDGGAVEGKSNKKKQKD